MNTDGRVKNVPTLLGKRDGIVAGPVTAAGQYHPFNPGGQGALNHGIAIRIETVVRKVRSDVDQRVHSESGRPPAKNAGRNTKEGSAHQCQHEELG